MRHFLLSSLLACLFFMLQSAAMAVNAGEKPLAVTEDALKAVYIYNFIRFSDWPETTTPPSAKGIKLSVMGDQSIQALMQRIAGKTGFDVMLSPHSCQRLACAKDSHVLFVGKSSADQLETLIAALKNRPVLTISDIPGFAKRGGMIEFRRQADRLTFTVNLQAVKRSGLYISAQILELGDILGDDQ